jgi:carboxylate-amine ligase
VPRDFGIEEEFVLLDPQTLTAVDRAPEAIAALRDEVRGVVGKEFFPSQVEFASPVFTTADEALDAVHDFRRRLAGWADAAGLVVAASGTPFRTRALADISPDDRYAHIAGDIAGVTPDHQINGMHVHVSIPDRESGVRASNVLRSWLPTLLAMASNSPFWHGVDTGFDSWRAIHSRRWTTYGVPPRFADAADHDATMQALRGIGATSDPGTINWNIRLSARYPTVEVRVFDTPLDPRSSVALAVVTRALVASSEREEPARPEIDITDAALWHAARYGVRQTLVDPQTDRLMPARDVLDVLVGVVWPHLRDDVERELVTDLRDRLVREGSGAQQQRAAHAAGTNALIGLYRRLLDDPVRPLPQPLP